MICDTIICDTIWKNARLATMATTSTPLGEVTEGLVASRAGRIVFAGPVQAAPPLEAEKIVDCAGRWITPGLVDCHTHLVYAGDRSHEFELRLSGTSYEEIARAGGGIAFTVGRTRAASEAELRAASLERLDAMLASGVTTVEIKSGYGLSLETELKQLRVARSLGELRRVNVRATFLGAHTRPPGCSDADAYIDTLCREMLPAVAEQRLADAVDAFCEGIGFTPAQTRRVFTAAAAHGLPVKLHADQLSNLGGGALAAEFGALSADHLEYADEASIAALARAGSVAVLLPGAFYFTRETQRPPIDRLRAHGVPMAVATDCNPGTSPLTSPLLALNMAATLFRMTVGECLLGVTRHAAQALGLADELGTLEAGKACDLAIWDIERPAELVCAIGANPLHARVWRGE
jgi:imidazolonepropionase